MWSDPEAFERRWIVQYPHPMVGEIGQVGLAFSFSETPARIQGPPTLVGEHTREILGELGASGEEIDALMEAGAVGDRNLHPALSGDSEGAVQSPWAPDK
jgi:crotonobetainyl-CoA:carnitine CoA-transferase CaiB-like acyl-CoA transferase